jgi:hypothetical protein
MDTQHSDSESSHVSAALSEGRKPLARNADTRASNDGRSDRVEDQQSLVSRESTKGEGQEERQETAAR